MATTPVEHLGFGSDRLAVNREAHSSGVAWGAVIGGSFVAAASYLILLALGAGFGLSTVSPWSNTGPTASTVGTPAIVWLILIEIAASALGGYLTGRFRTKWALIHTDEVYFRDTANGFLAWAVALVISVTFLASAATSMVGRISPVAFGDRSDTSASLANPNGYFVDTMFRTERIGNEQKDRAAKAEAGRIFATALVQDQMSTADQAYMAKLISAQTGVTDAEAQERVSRAMTAARKSEDIARKATAHFLLWLFLSLLTGAFSASYAATIGGRQRDHVKAI